jgi:copper chaperone CopZ
VCDACSLALRRFIGGFEGVESIDVAGRNITVAFDQEKRTGAAVMTAALDSLEKLGHKLAA